MGKRNPLCISSLRSQSHPSRETLTFLSNILTIKNTRPRFRHIPCVHWVRPIKIPLFWGSSKLPRSSCPTGGEVKKVSRRPYRNQAMRFVGSGWGTFAGTWRERCGSITPFRAVLMRRSSIISGRNRRSSDGKSTEVFKSGSMLVPVWSCCCFFSRRPSCWSLLSWRRVLR